jgi:hypothetical protein
MFIVPVLLFVTVYGSPRFFELRTVHVTSKTCDISAENETLCAEEVLPELHVNPLRQDPYYVSVSACN